MTKRTILIKVLYFEDLKTYIYFTFYTPIILKVVTDVIKSDPPYISSASRIHKSESHTYVTHSTWLKKHLTYKEVWLTQETFFLHIYVYIHCPLVRWISSWLWWQKTLKRYVFRSIQWFQDYVTNLGTHQLAVFLH